MPLPLQQIGTVDARRRDLDQHLVRTRAGGLDISRDSSTSGAPDSRCNDGFHAPKRATGADHVEVG